MAVTNSIRAHSTCPVWYPDNERPPQDERLALDAALGRGRGEQA